jgi:hypothetical protein
MPQSTDLVTDLPADFETFGQAVATSMADLLGGTTGQILSKASNTDMDFTWVTTDDANAIQNSIVDAKGDIVAASANDTPARLAVGSNGETLVADSSTSTGLRYQGDYAAGKNKIINGTMQIDQRATTTTINAAAATYTLDRWVAFGQAADGVFTVAQDSSAPAGFSKSLKIAVTTADASIASTQTYTISQRIEGQNIVDFSFGNASAKTVTLSFWVRSSLTGTFGGSLRNSANDRSYVFSYAISVADTWEKKTITIAGDTTGTWLTDNSTGMQLSFGLGQGTDRAETAGAWYASNRAGATGQVQVIGTLSATWYVTGVQLEIGNVATAFQTATGTIQGELAACQRYYYRLTFHAATQRVGVGLNDTTTTATLTIPYPVTMRTNPSALEQSGTAGDYSVFNATGSITVCSAVPSFQSATPAQSMTVLTVAAGLTIGAGAFGRNVNTSAYFGWSAEL